MTLPTPVRRLLPAAVFVWLLLIAVWAPAAFAQDEAPQRSLQAVVAEAILEDGWWDESGTLPAAEMEALVQMFGDEFAFAFTDRSFVVEGGSTDQSTEDGPQVVQSASFLIAQATLDLLATSGGPSTILFITGDEVGGASNTFPFFNIGQVLADFDRSDAPAQFSQAAIDLLVLGDNFAEIPQGAVDEQLGQGSDLNESPETGIFAGMRIVIILAIIAAALAVASVISSRNKKARRAVTTADARDDTKDQLQAMSDLILDLDPRVSISDDRALKDRFVDASSTYRAVLEKAEGAKTGHEVADLRIDISKARWKLDVIDAELSGRTPPKEPFSRDNTGSAWDSTRGRGGDS